MPYEDPDPTDPMTLHGVIVETSDDRAMVEMAACFIEEYARMGFDAERIMRVFNTSGYAGPTMALHALGELRIRTLIDEAMQLRGPNQPDRPALEMTNDGLSLPVLDAGE